MILEGEVDDVFTIEPGSFEPLLAGSDFCEVAERMNLPIEIATFEDDEAVRHSVLVAMVHILPYKLHQIR